ncbi:uncharacterized protein LOC110450351 [Mizuhopecten yessoensis]|nr:uncharacterized protein LOC110450351 [Mizuhopecten yessoensis]
MFDKLRFRYGSAGITEVNVNTTSEHVLPSESVTIRFTSDESHSLPGFKLSYSITGCTCVSTSGLDVKATYTRKYITSPGFPRAYHHNTMCRWNIATSTACTLLRLETIVVETEDRLDTPTIKYDGGLPEKISNKTYYIPSNRSVLQFKTDGSVSKRGFNMSYQAEDLHIAKNSSVFGCKDSQLLAEARSKYVFSSNYPENSMDTDCNWMIFAAEPCTTTGTVNGSRLSIVVEEFKSNGSSPIAIFQAQSRGSITIHVPQESSLVGQPLDFYVLAEEFVLITVRHIGESSVFKLSYQITELKAETEHQSDDTLLIALASTICIVCIVTVIVHIVVRLYCRKRSSQTKPSDTVKFHNEGKVKTKRPYVDMGIRDHSENGNQRETSSTGDIYEDVGNAEDLGANKQDYYYIDTPGAENEQHSDMYINTDTINVDHEPSVSIRNDGDEDVYEEIDIPSTSRLNS